MDQPVCKLTLVYPPKAEDHIVELMLTSDPPLSGFTTWTAEGHGHDFATASVSERVRGRVHRGVLVAVMPRERAARLLDEIQSRCSISHLAYWIEPVESMGILTPVAAQDDGTEPVAFKSERAT